MSAPVPHEFRITNDIENDLVKMTQLYNELVALYNEVALHANNGVHQNSEVTSTNDATSVVDAPLKTAGGLAVAKKAIIGDAIFLQGRPEVLRRGPLNESVELVWDNSLKTLLAGEQVRIRLRATADTPACINARYIDNNGIIEKQFWARWGLVGFANPSVREVWRLSHDSSAMSLEHVGVDRQADLIIRNNFADQSRWSLFVEVQSGRSNSKFELISVHFESIP